MPVNSFSFRILLVPLLLVPLIAAAQLSRGSQQIRIVELNPTLGLSPRQLIEGKGDLKSWDLSIDYQSQLAQLPHYVDREAPILEVECFYPDLKLVYRDYTYLVSTHCGVIHKYRNLKPWQPSRYPLADDFIFTESLVHYFHTLRDSLFGGRFDSFFEALSESTPSAYAVHLQRQGRAEPEVLLSDVQIVGKLPAPEPMQPVNEPVPQKLITPEPEPKLAAVQPTRPLPAPKGDPRDTPQPPQRRGSVPKIIHTPASGSDLPAYLKPQPAVRKRKSEDDDLLESMGRDEFELEPFKPEPIAPPALAQNPITAPEPTVAQSEHIPVVAAESEPPAQIQPTAPVSAEPEPQAAPQPIRPPRPQPVLTQDLATSQGRLPVPRIEPPHQPIFASNQLFTVVVTEPEIMLEPEPQAIQKPTTGPDLVAVKPEPKPEPVAQPVAPAAKPSAPAVKAPAVKADAEESLDVDINLDEVEDQGEDGASDEGMDGVEGLMDDDRDGFIDEFDSSDRDINALFGDDEDDLDFDDDDDLDIDDF